MAKQPSFKNKVHTDLFANGTLRKDAFAISDEQKIAAIEIHFKAIMDILGLDTNANPSLRDTPHRVAKMFVQEIFKGINPKRKPVAKLFPNEYQYGEMLVEKNISLYSTCEHHFIPIIGKAHVAYISNGSIIGLSKLHRIVEYYTKQPQVQERLTVQIGQELQQILQTKNVAVLIDAKHLCVAARGIQDVTSTTLTTFYGGLFEKDCDKRNAFMRVIGVATEL